MFRVSQSNPVLFINCYLNFSLLHEFQILLQYIARALNIVGKDIKDQLAPIFCIKQLSFTLGTRTYTICLKLGFCRTTLGCQQPDILQNFHKSLKLHKKCQSFSQSIDLGLTTSQTWPTSCRRRPSNACASLGKCVGNI